MENTFFFCCFLWRNGHRRTKKKKSQFPNHKARKTFRTTKFTHRSWVQLELKKHCRPMSSHWKRMTFLFFFAIHFQFDFHNMICSNNRKNMIENILLEATYECYLHNSQYLNRQNDVFSCIAVYVCTSFLLITPKYIANVKMVHNLTAWWMHLLFVWNFEVFMHI